MVNDRPGIGSYPGALFDVWAAVIDEQFSVFEHQDVLGSVRVRMPPTNTTPGESTLPVCNTGSVLRGGGVPG